MAKFEQIKDEPEHWSHSYRNKDDKSTIKSINNKFDALKLKLSNLSGLISENIFDITTTGNNYYDDILYKKIDENVVGKIQWINPMEYFEESYKMNIKYASEHSFEHYMKNCELNVSHVTLPMIENISKGIKMNLPVLDYNKMTNTGTFGVSISFFVYDKEKIPVLIVENKL